MKNSLRIPLTLTVVVIMAGIAIYVNRSFISNKPLPSSSTIIIWAVVSVILVGITIWSWMRGKNNKKN